MICATVFVEESTLSFDNPAFFRNSTSAVDSPLIFWHILHLSISLYDALVCPVFC